MKKRASVILIIVLVLAMSLALSACLSGSVYAESNGSETGIDNGTVSNGSSDDKGGGAINAPDNAGGSFADTVTYRATFHVFSGTNVEPMDTWVIQYAPVTTRTGYRFIGWYLESDFSGEVVVFPYTMSADTDFYACWESAGSIAVSTVEDLKAIGADDASMVADYYLTNDIYITDEEWIPIGLNYDLLYDEEGEIEYIQLKGTDAPQAFAGTLDGHGYTIYNLNLKPFVTEKETNYLPYGLFSRLGSKTYNGRVYAPTIRNLKINNYNITIAGHLSKFYLGAFAGVMEAGLITNCHSIGKINNPKIEYDESIWDDFFGSYANPTERTDMGGIVGRLTAGTVSLCGAEGEITSESVADDVNVGGLVGYVDTGIVSGSRASVAVKGRYAGGLVGTNAGQIINSFATGNVNANLSFPAVGGGLVSVNTVTGYIQRCYSTGTVTARTAGGLIGANTFSYITALGGIVVDCYSVSNVHAAEYGGGLIGRAEADISVEGNESPIITDSFYFIRNCIAYGNVSVIVEDVYYEMDNGDIIESNGVYHSAFAGGLIGHAHEVRMSGCIALGDVVARSLRPIGDGAVYNSVYADNLVGQSSNLINRVSVNIYGAEGQSVIRNEYAFSGYNSAPIIARNGATGGNHLSSFAFLSSIGFDPLVWNLEGLNVPDGRYPVLK